MLSPEFNVRGKSTNKSVCMISKRLSFDNLVISLPIENISKYLKFWSCLKYLHQEDVLVAVVPEHVIVHLGHDPVLVLAVEEPDVGGADFVLVLDGVDQSMHCWRNEVKGRVHIL